MCNEFDRMKTMFKNMYHRGSIVPNAGNRCSKKRTDNWILAVWTSSVTIPKVVEVGWLEQKPDCNESKKRELDTVSTDNSSKVLFVRKKIWYLLPVSDISTQLQHRVSWKSFTFLKAFHSKIAMNNRNVWNSFMLS